MISRAPHLSSQRAREHPGVIRAGEREGRAHDGTVRDADDPRRGSDHCAAHRHGRRGTGLPPVRAGVAAAPRIVLLPDPAVPGAPNGVWWPPPVLDPAWIGANRTAAQVLHIHFGTESFAPGHLTDVIEAAHAVGWPVVYTAHDLPAPAARRPGGLCAAARRAGARSRRGGDAHRRCGHHDQRSVGSSCDRHTASARWSLRMP